MKKRQLRAVSQNDIVTGTVVYEFTVLQNVFDVTFSKGKDLWRYVVAQRLQPFESLAGELSHRWKKVKDGTAAHVGLQVAKGILLNFLNS